jgi:WhiB family redox-sensing transcriptional regulator
MTACANWRDNAACRDADPELFFPTGTAGPALHQIGEAKRICQACSAQIQCLAWALGNGITDGVWGGITEDERRAMRSLPRTLSTSQEDGDADSYQPTEHAEQGRRAQAAQGKATRKFSSAQAGDGPGRTGPGQLHCLQSARGHDDRTGSYRCEGFIRDFATADGETVRVAALTRRQFADLATTTSLAGTFAFLERALDADFCTCGGLYTHRVIIAALLAPWFARHTVAELTAAFAGTSVPWGSPGRGVDSGAARS